MTNNIRRTLKTKTIIACAVAFFTILAAFGQTRTDTAKVYFRIGECQLDSALDGNLASIESFVGKIRTAVADNNIDSIIVRAYASPDGFNATNVRLSKLRCDVIVRYIIERTGVSPDLIQAVPGGIAWTELRNLVAANPDVPSREKVLDVLDNMPLWVFDSRGKVIDGRKKRLMSLDAGVPYRWMLENLFPQLRNAVAMAVYLTPAGTGTTDTAVAEDSPVLADTIIRTEVPDTAVLSDTTDITATPAMADTVVRTPSEHTHRFALKTNIPYYAILMPNLEFEWLVNDRWSVALEGNVAWWSNDAKLQYYRLLTITPEVRRWIRPRKPWHGMYVGLFAGTGLYDLENGKAGYQGEGVMSGLSLGYMWPVGKHLSLEAGIGAGYMYTQYKEYMPFEGHFLYQRTKSMHYFGPLKLKFSIAWHLGNIKKTKITISD